MRSDTQPEVSVVITNYNYAKYLTQAIESVKNQTYKNISLVLVDDASSDGSAEIFDDYKDIATLVINKKNQGIVRTRNAVLDNITSPYVIFLDADDWLDPDYVETLVKYAQLKRLDIVYCNAQYFISEKGDMNEALNPPEFSLERLKNGNYIHISSLMSTKAIGDTRFDRSMEKLTHEDWDFFLNLGLQHLKIGYTDQAELNYRVKPVNRNMHLDDKIGFASLYIHIYEKYSSKYPSEFNYLAYYRFAVDLRVIGKKYLEAEKSIDKYQARSERFRDELDDVRSSKSYIIGRLLLLTPRTLKNAIKSCINATRSMKSIFLQSDMYKSSVENRFNSNIKKYSDEEYFIERRGAFAKTSKFAVVVHLYHEDRWQDAFRDKLVNLSKDLPFDLFITLPEKNVDSITHIQKDFPDANFLIIPNKGRDVLPFIKTARLLEDMKYEKVLKLHSKKSQHRDKRGNSAESGDDWLVNTLDSLIPSNAVLRKKLIKLLNQQTTGLIGAQEYYYPLKMYLKNNRMWLEILLKKVGIDIFHDWDTAQKLKSYGYFGGTMFWIDLKSIGPIIDLSEKTFQPEKGQFDGTIAHALERMFCLMPQISNLKIYGLLGQSLVELNTTDTQYPSWYYDDVSGGKPPISIVVPVYSDWYSLSKNIASLKKLLANSEDISVYYVNDCGPEADDLEVKIKAEIKGLTNFYYFRNDHNLGFVKSCNQAVLEIVNQKSDVLLLNSDTKVTNNFVAEMRAVLYSEDTIGAVTSRSNNATIWSVPMTSKLAHHRWASYLLYRLIKHVLPQKYITPTIHGFCVLIRRSVIDEYGLFDEIYGKGYGEENDFAMRIQQQGWQCAVANYSYVFHYESRSFGSEARNKQIEMNEKILTRRYPNYRASVQEYWDRIKEPFK